MVGKMTVVKKPSRSDDVLDEDQQLKIANQIRAQFDSITPRRPLKPNRSEPDSSTPTPVGSIVDPNISELDKFHSLQSQSHVIFSGEGVTKVEDEYVETQYYRELDSIDKQHHTTGSGFIRVLKDGSEEGCDYNIQLPEGHNGVASWMVHEGFRGNPATNDWVPRIDEDDQRKGDGCDYVSALANGYRLHLKNKLSRSCMVHSGAS
ncbi:hypothetical protein FNV43_RR17113 [Rhamnella rubrinervis]|uniref:Uncharacterized protein n=1 Tax=Rhamnella rubrinervis TaxID=2594499 RepID=A0A8K0GVH3_9ROSA|nr:hypothetical protein FNV43_RR17113 [Rhamnella rubrinervis]